MRISKAKYELAMARACKERKDLIAAGIPVGTLARIYSSELKPVSVGRIAQAIGCDVTDIIED